MGTPEDGHGKTRKRVGKEATAAAASPSSYAAAPSATSEDPALEPPSSGTEDAHAAPEAPVELAVNRFAVKVCTRLNFTHPVVSR